jgi:uncharacterized protein (TIGR02996 family)
MPPSLARPEEFMSTDERATPRESEWRWPREPEWLQSAHDRAAALAEARVAGLPDAVNDNDELRRAVIASPDDDTPRRAYAAWMASQEHEFAQLLGAFIGAQLRVAEAFRADPRAEVAALRRWRGDAAYVSTPDFRAGDALRPWFQDTISPLASLGLAGWPQIYRGFVERVSVRASRFLEIADELFRRAPIRYLVLVGVGEVVDELAASPHLARIRSLSLPRHRPEDDLTDDALRRLLTSPHLGQLAHLRLVHQHRLTARAYEDVVTAPTLPQLSSFEVYMPMQRWHHLERADYDPRSRFERLIAYDIQLRSMRPVEWIVELEQAIGYVPCAHPEDHYGWGLIDIEAIVERPIALDAQVMACRGAGLSTLPRRRQP